MTAHTTRARVDHRDDGGGGGEAEPSRSRRREPRQATVSGPAATPATPRTRGAKLGVEGDANAAEQDER